MHLAIPPLSISSSDIQVTCILLSVTAAWLLLWQQLTRLQLVPSKTTRKILHTTCGPALLAFWPFYSDLPTARFLAAIAPILIMLALIISGSSRAQSVFASLGRTLSRQGDAAEALRGPFYYCIILLSVTVLLFKTEVAMIMMAQLCIGDGVADIVGRRFGASNKWGWEWTGEKSVAGSLAFWAGAFGASCVVLSLGGAMGGEGWVVLNWEGVAKVGVVSLVCAAVELACPKVLGDDNVSVTIAALATSLLLFGRQVL